MIQGKEKHPPLHLTIVAMEKGAFGSPSTKVTNLTFYMVSSNYAGLIIGLCTVIGGGDPVA